MDLQPDPEPFDMSEYMINGEWNLKCVSPLFCLYKICFTAGVAATKANRSVTFYDCCPEPYPDVKFVLVMQRRVLYYAINLIIPNTAITLLTLLGFLLPVEAYEKITLRTFGLPGHE